MLGVTMAYNEADCIGNAIRCLLHAGHDRVLVFDHGSTDGTRKVIKAFGPPVELRRISRKAVPFERLFQAISREIRAEKGFDWLTWIAADEILLGPSGQPVTREDYIRAATQTDVIEPGSIEFWVSDADDANEQDYLRRMMHYQIRDPRRPPCPRVWKSKLMRIMPQGLHHRWPKPIKTRHCGWIIAHYPVRTIAQGQRKIMRERPSRAIQYSAFRAKSCKNLVKHASAMIKIKEPIRFSDPVEAVCPSSS